MAQQPKIVVRASGAGPPTDSDRPAGATIPSEFPRFHFGLRHLLFFVAAVSTVLAGLVSLHGIPALALLLAALVVAFHVLGTALGSQLRLHANRTQATNSDPITSAASIAKAPDRSAPREPLLPIRSPFYGRSGGSFAWLPRLVATAVFFGGCLGAIFLTATIGQRTSLAGLVIGAFSIAVLSGWFAFLGGNFYAIVRGGLREAIAEQQQDDVRSPH